MNNKGQMAMVGTILLIAIGIIVALSLLSGTYSSIGAVTSTVDIANQSLATVVNGTPQYLVGYKALANPVVINETGGVIIDSGNYTITDNVVHNGVATVEITPNAEAAWKTAWKISGTAQPDTYDTSAGGRAMLQLVLIFAALAIAIFALAPTLREKLFDMF